MLDYVISVRFCEGVTKSYDLRPLFEKMPVFKKLKEQNGLFEEVTVDVGGYGIFWNDELDLSCDEIWKNGKITQTVFDGLMALTEATKIWCLNESTLRKAIAYGKLVFGVDVYNFSKQWVITTHAMKREYGDEPSKQKV